MSQFKKKKSEIINIFQTQGRIFWTWDPPNERSLPTQDNTKKEKIESGILHNLAHTVTKNVLRLPKVGIIKCKAMKSTTYRFEQEGQCTYNVILSRVQESFLPWKSNKYYILVCACEHECRYSGSWACACAYVHVDLLIRMQRVCAILWRHLWPPRSPPHFSILSHKRCDFRKKAIKNKICVLIFSTTFV
jgi:hypothetical protein